VKKTEALQLILIAVLLAAVLALLIAILAFRPTPPPASGIPGYASTASCA
jgi:ABC-type proline/glycine betaine transport system permease subunit